MGSARFWLGLLIGIVVAVVFGLLVLPYLGLFDMSASGGGGVLDWWGNTNLEHSLSRRAPKETVPATADPKKAVGEYSSSCQQCHGTPTESRADWAEHMLPTPPKLWEPGTQEMTDGELFQVVKDGVRMSGMPAFGKTLKEEEIWNLVAFVRKMARDKTDQPKPEAAGKK